MLSYNIINQMGKKIKLINNDPILTKNYKFEKRKQERIAERLKMKQDQEKQLMKKNEAEDVERHVDERIEGIVAVQKSKYINKYHNQKQKMMQSKTQQPHTPANKNKKCQLIEISQQSPHEPYLYHFNTEVSEEMLCKDKRENVVRKIEEETKKEIRSMFAQESQAEEEEEELGGQEEEEKVVYNLLPSCKTERQVQINSFLYNATANFLKHSQNLSLSSVEQPSQQLQMADSVISNYFDHVYIENKSEESIEDFRRIVVKHAIRHLRKCELNEKSKGFTNGKILILTPFIGDVRAILDLIEEEYEGYSISNRQKLEDFQDENDFFRLALRQNPTKKTLTYFTNFTTSQIILASPLGLKTIIGSQGDKKRQNSFISSLEMIYLDRASVMMMQNWAHLMEIMKNVNMMPKYQSLRNAVGEIREGFMRLRGRLYRQNIVFSEYNFPELNSLKYTHFHNHQGALTSKLYYQPLLLPQHLQKHFFKLDLKEPKQDLSTRFNYFKRKFWDNINSKQTMRKVVIFVSSYFEYVKLKSFLVKVNASAEFVCEHTSKAKVQSRVAQFNNNQVRILVLTQRAYYFQICQLRKYHHIYFYSPPKNVFIFQQMLQSLVEDDRRRCIVNVMYSRFDVMVLERIVGSAKAGEMVREYCNNVSFII